MEIDLPIHTVPVLLRVVEKEYLWRKLWTLQQHLSAINHIYTAGVDCEDILTLPDGVMILPTNDIVLLIQQRTELLGELFTTNTVNIPGPNPGVRLSVVMEEAGFLITEERVGRYGHTDCWINQRRGHPLVPADKPFLLLETIVKIYGAL